MISNHEIETEEGQKISAVHHEAESDKWMFLCHGFGGNKEGNIRKRSQELQKNGWNTVRFDFRGNGESEGDFINQDLSSRILDLKTVVDYFSADKCVVFGSSFGGKVVFHFAKQDNRAVAVIGKAPVTYNGIMSKFRSVVDNKGEYEYIDGKPIDKKFFKDFENYRFEKVAECLDIPVAIFHGSADTTVHAENSFKAAKDLNTSVSLFKLKGEKHSFSDNGEIFMKNEMVSWLNNIKL